MEIYILIVVYIIIIYNYESAAASPVSKKVEGSRSTTKNEKFARYDSSHVIFDSKNEQTGRNIRVGKIFFLKVLPAGGQQVIKTLFFFSFGCIYSLFPPTHPCPARLPGRRGAQVHQQEQPAPQPTLVMVPQQPQGGGGALPPQGAAYWNQFGAGMMGAQQQPGGAPQQPMQFYGQR